MHLCVGATDPKAINLGSRSQSLELFVEAVVEPRVTEFNVED